MSQICPSSSHQLVAAAMAFRRARRKFPKNFGLYNNAEETTKFDNIENVSGNEEANDQENLPFPPRNCSNAMSNRTEGKTFWNDECGESGSITGNLLQKPIICSCCRKRNDQCNAGDALDIVPSKEHNNGITEKSEFFKSEKVESCNAKGMRSFITEPRNSNRGSYYCSRRRSPRETSKLDSVNLLYGRDQNEVDNVRSSDSSEKRNCNSSVHDCNVERRGHKSFHRDSRCTFASQKDNHPSSSSISRACHFHCAKHSTLDLLQPHRDCCRQNRHYCCHSHDHCHHRCDNEYSNCSSKEKRLASDTCLCATNSANNRRDCCHKEHTTRESVCNHNCCAKDSEKISTVQEQNDEEPDDPVGSINHKDSLCILVEKYKSNKKCKHKAVDASEFPCERTKDECDKSFTSETSCQLDEIVKQGEHKHSSGSFKCRFRDNRRVSIGKTCTHGCGPIFGQEECNQFKNLKSRLIKTGTCCSAKGTPWRHTF